MTILGNGNYVSSILRTVDTAMVSFILFCSPKTMVIKTKCLILCVKWFSNDKRIKRNELSTLSVRRRRRRRNERSRYRQTRKVGEWLDNVGKFQEVPALITTRTFLFDEHFFCSVQCWQFYEIGGDLKGTWPNDHFVRTQVVAINFLPLKTEVEGLIKSNFQVLNILKSFRPGCHHCLTGSFKCVMFFRITSRPSFTGSLVAS